jgi:glutaredoxin 2
MSNVNANQDNTQYSLYYYDSCPFCARVLRSLQGLKVNVELRNVFSDASYRNELQKATRRTTVPCLRIDNGKDTEWMFESMDIIRYLQSL